MWGGGSGEAAGAGGGSTLSPISHENTADAGDIELGDEARVRDEAVATDIGESPGDGEAELRPLSGGSSRPVWSVWSRGTLGGPGTSGSASSAAYRRPTTGGSASSGARSARSVLPGETDNEDEEDLLEEQTETSPAPHVLIAVAEASLSQDGRSPARDTEDETQAYFRKHDENESLQLSNHTENTLAAGHEDPSPASRELFVKSDDSAGSASGSKASGFLSDRRSSDKRGSTTSSRTRKTTSRGTSPRSEHQNGSRQKILFYGSVGLVVVVIVAVVAVVTAPKPSACVIGDYYGKRLNQTSEADACVPCPLGQSSEGGMRESAKCFCTSGYYTPIASALHTPGAPIDPLKCLECERGLYAPSKVAIGRQACQRYYNYWKLGEYGASCATTCEAHNMTLDAAGLRLWEQRFPMEDVLNMIAYQINVTCVNYALSYRNAGPFMCAHPDCGAIQGLCYTPVSMSLFDLWSLHHMVALESPSGTEDSCV